jgi:hypothetical protein
VGFASGKCLFSGGQRPRHLATNAYHRQVGGTAVHGRQSASDGGITWADEELSARTQAPADVPPHFSSGAFFLITISG